MRNNCKILLTGATGSIGKVLIKALYSKEYELAVVVRNYEKARDIFASQPQVKIIDFQADNWANEVFEFSPEVVFHLASMLTSRDDLEIIPSLIDSNITFGAQLLQSLKKTDVKIFINTGSFAEFYYGDGQLDSTYLYAATKTAFHSIIKYYQQLSGFKVVNVMPYTVYGQVDSQPKAIDIIYNSFYSEKSIDMSGGEQTLDFIHIDDVVFFYCLLLESEFVLPLKWNNYHLGTGNGVTLRKVAQLISSKLTLPEKINWGAFPYRPRDTMYSVAPIAKIINHFGWQPVININEGIDKFLLQK